jgi:hypothetical protein
LAALRENVGKALKFSARVIFLLKKQEVAGLGVQRTSRILKKVKSQNDKNIPFSSWNVLCLSLCPSGAIFFALKFFNQQNAFARKVGCA